MSYSLNSYSSTRSEWSKNLSLIIFLCLMFAGIFAVNKISETFTGYFTETKAEVVVKNKQLEQNIQDVQKAAEVTVQNKEDVKESVVTLAKTTYENKTKTSEIQTKKEKKVQEILITPNLTPEVKDKKIAEAEIDMLWENFCRIDPTACKEKQNA